MKEKGRFFFVLKRDRGHEGLIREVSSVSCSRVVMLCSSLVELVMIVTISEGSRFYI